MKKHLLKTIALVFVLALACVALAACGQKLTPVKDSVMTVNGQDVPKGVFNYYMNSTKEYLSAYGIDFETEEGKGYLYYIEAQSYEMLKEVAAVRGAALDKGLKIDEAERDKLLKEEKASFSTDEAFQKWLTENEMEENDVLWLVESQLLGEAYYNEVTKEIKVADEDAKAAFDADPDKYITKKFAHIFLEVPDDATDADKAEIKKKAEGFIKELDNGGDFAAIATQNNTDSTAETGGSLSQTVTRDTSTYVEEFNKAAFALTKAGEYTKTPVETSFGYHIIKLEEVTDSFENLKESIAEGLSSTEKEETYSAALDALMKDVKIQKDYVPQYANPAASTGETDGADGADADKDADNKEGETAK